jgi:hypothetical protein
MSCNNSGNLFWIKDPRILYQDSNYLQFIPTQGMDRISQLNALTRFTIYIIILAFILSLPGTVIQIAILFIMFLIFLYFAFTSDKQEISREAFRSRGIDVNALGDEDYPGRNDDEQEPVIMEAGYYDSDNKLIVDKYLGSQTVDKRNLKFSFDDYTAYEKSIARTPTKDNPLMNPLLGDISLGPDEPPAAANTDDAYIKDKIVETYNDKLYRDIDDLFERENSQRQFYTVPTTYPNDQTAFANWCYKSADNSCKVDQRNCLRYEDLRTKRLGQGNN